MIPVIICGGAGTKLWPISRQFKPKHFIKLIGDKSLFQLNCEALMTKFDPKDIFVSTNESQMGVARVQVPEIPEENYIIEPEMKNQGPATGLIAAYLYKKGLKDEPFMIIQVDDLRDPVENFIKMMLDCDNLARNDSRYITAGFKPDTPVMGVDYLLKGEKVSSDEQVNAYKVDKFIWRGSPEQTEELLKNPNLLLHANHTCMTPVNFLNMLEKYKKEWHGPLMSYINGSDLKEEYAKMPPGPLEDVTQQVHVDGGSLVVEIPFVWNDFGTFDSIFKYLVEKGLYKTPENVVDLNGKNNFLRLDDNNKVVGLLGIEDVYVIDTGDVLLICHKGQTGQVGEVLKEVKNRKMALT
jgi:mannose-1-phosphate guanylyltransferase